MNEWRFSCYEVGVARVKTVVSGYQCYFFVQERTSVIVGVKAELAEPHPSTPQLGQLDFHVDW